MSGRRAHFGHSRLRKRASVAAPSPILSDSATFDRSRYFSLDLAGDTFTTVPLAANRVPEARMTQIRFRKLLPELEASRPLRIACDFESSATFPSAAIPPVTGSMKQKKTGWPPSVTAEPSHASRLSEPCSHRALVYGHAAKAPLGAWPSRLEIQDLTPIPSALNTLDGCESPPRPYNDPQPPSRTTEVPNIPGNAASKTFHCDELDTDVKEVP